MAKGKRKRKSRTSQGIHGGGGKGRPLSTVEKVLMGGGLLVNVKKRAVKDTE